jgi:hypothetical protein
MYQAMQATIYARHVFLNRTSASDTLLTVASVRYLASNLAGLISPTDTNPSLNFPQSGRST